MSGFERFTFHPVRPAKFHGHVEVRDKATGQPVGQLNRMRGGYVLRDLDGTQVGESWGVSRPVAAAALEQIMHD